jgi:hypothetical protein
MRRRKGGCASAAWALHAKAEVTPAPKGRDARVRSAIPQDALHVNPSGLGRFLLAGPSGSELSHSVAPPSEGMCKR